MTKFSNYWETTVDQNSEIVEVELPKKCDVLIVGGGSNGVSTAFHLAKQGVNVVLLEKNHIGWGASGRNGGMALTGLKEGGSTLIKKYGLEKAKAFFDASLMAVDLVKNIIDTEKLAVDVAHTGHIEVASKPAHFDALKHEQKILYDQFGHETQLFDQNKLSDELSTDIYYGGLFDQKSIGVNPLQYVTELANRARTLGVTILENCSLRSISKAKTKHQIVTNKGIIDCEHLVLSTSAYTEKELGSRRNTHIKIGSYVLATEVLPFDGNELIRDGRSIFDTLNFLSYYRVTADNRLLYGGRAVFDRESDLNIHKSAEILKRMMAHVFPRLFDTKIDYVWGGTLDVTLNKMPAIRNQSNVSFSVGYAGHGIAISTYFGKLIAGRILGAGSYDPFTVENIPSVPFPNFQKVYLPFVEKYYRWLDIIN